MQPWTFLSPWCWWMLLVKSFSIFPESDFLGLVSYVCNWLDDGLWDPPQMKHLDNAPQGGGGGGGTLIFSYICRLSYFLGFNILNFNIFGVFRKMNNFWEWRFCGYFWGVITKLGYIKGPFLCILGSVQNGGYFLGLLKFQIFFGVLEIPDIFWHEW